MLLWGLFFLSALEELVMAGAFASWYWTFNKKDIPAAPLSMSAWRAFRYAELVTGKWEQVPSFTSISPQVPPRHARVWLPHHRHHQVHPHHDRVRRGEAQGVQPGQPDRQGGKQQQVEFPVASR